jgi:ubiquinone/menaquinone biosynthesis C-methylase UbiE
MLCAAERGQDISHCGARMRAKLSMVRAAIQQRRWQNKVQPWHGHVTSSPTHYQIRETVLREADPKPGDRVVDLGAGTGFLSLPIAPHVTKVLCVDIAQPMLDELWSQAAEQGQDNVEPVCADPVYLDLPAKTVDLVVSNFALHHLTDADKKALVQRARRWLRPGGRIVIADTMFGRGRTKQDRAIIWSQIRRRAAKGLGGLWRIIKNGVRFGILHRGRELPAPPRFWVRALQHVGFCEVRYEDFPEAAGLVVARVPGPSA